MNFAFKSCKVPLSIDDHGVWKSEPLQFPFKVEKVVLTLADGTTEVRNRVMQARTIGDVIRLPKGATPKGTKSVYLRGVRAT